MLNVSRSTVSAAAKAASPSPSAVVIRPATLPGTSAYTSGAPPRSACSTLATTGSGSYATATASVPMCGESVARGIRALVLVNGVPASKVAKFQLLRVNPPSEDISPLQLIAKTVNAPLKTVTGTPPCPSFQYQFEYGTVTFRKSLRPNTFVLVATANVGGQLKSRTVQFNINTCDFDKDLVLSLP